MDEQIQISLMKKQVNDMMKNPSRYEKMFASGYVYAGFGGDLNGVHVPETFMSGKLPAGVTPRQALMQVIAFMQETIRKAEREHGKISDDKPLLEI